MDDFEGVGDDADRHKLFAIISAIHLKGVRQTLDDRALSLSESLDCISAGGV
jgi:hypothetical protein